MKSKLLVVMAVAVGLLVVAGPMFAHHAQSYYDRNHTITLTGTVTEYEFANPHVQIHFDGKDENGKVSSWTAESGAPQTLYRSGWNKNSLKTGDLITVTGFPSKEGKKISIRKLVAPDGKILDRGAE